MRNLKSLPDLVERVGYPSLERQDFWITPRAPIGIENGNAKRILVLYWEGAPRVVFALDLSHETVLAYAGGKAFSQPPPLVVVLDDADVCQVWRFDGGSYQVIPQLLPWQELLHLPRGMISPEQAQAIINKIATENKTWFKDERSQRIVGVLPRIFPEGTVIVYELLQNAADSGATKATFSIEGDTLLFMHDGDPFTENDVYAISFVNCSFKPPEMIGFMGLGFKATYEACDKPEIYSPPFHFGFDNTVLGGELFPEQIMGDYQQMPDGFTTLFRLPLKKEMRDSLVHELEQFDGLSLFYMCISQKHEDRKLKKLATPKGNFKVVLDEQRIVSGDEPNVRHTKVELKDSRAVESRYFRIFTKEFEPSPEGIENFATARGMRPGQYIARRQEISIAVELKKEVLDSEKEGKLQVYLPTGVRLPTAFDVQGNFLLDASRRVLRDVSGPWNREHFNQIIHLVASMLRWAKTRASEGQRDWANYYDLIPDWDRLHQELGFVKPSQEELHDETNEHAMPSWKTEFKEILARRELIPVTDTTGSLRFVGPDLVACVDKDLEVVFGSRDLATMMEQRRQCPIQSELGQTAKTRLSAYVQPFGPQDLARLLQEEGWERNISTLKQSPSSKAGRIKLVNILVYFKNHELEVQDLIRQCRLILIQSGGLRATDQKDGKKVYSLTERVVDFPTQELESRYDIVHKGLLRELIRPGDIGLEPAITHTANEMLKLLAPELKPKIIAKEIILPLFQDDRWKHIPDDRLLRYTLYLLMNSKQLELPSEDLRIRVKVKGPERPYAPPEQVYFGSEYSLDGEKLEMLCRDTSNVKFLSPDYIPQTSQVSSEDWRKFFSTLGVTDLPRVSLKSSYYPEHTIEKVKEITGESELPENLRVSQLGDVPGRHYAVDDYKLDPYIAEIVNKLHTERPLGWKDGIRHFALLLDSGWKNYQEKLKKILRYAEYFGASFVTRKTSTSSFAHFLKDEPWVPAKNIDRACKPSDLVLDTPENRRLASEHTLFSYCEFKNKDLIEFLNLNQHPPESTPLQRLRDAVNRGVADLDQFVDIYTELGRSEDTSKIRQIQNAFTTDKLIFVPNHEPHYVSLNQVVYSEETSLSPFLVSIAGIYPKLKRFFCDVLRVPSEEQLDHYISFLSDYVWKKQPPVADKLRNSIESCYRRLHNCLADATDKSEELKKKLGPSPMVFCIGTGWTNTREKTVIYADTSAYANQLKKVGGIAVESHLKRLYLPLVELEPLLEVLNVQPLPRVLKVNPTISSHRDYEGGELLSRRLSLLLRRAVNIVKAEQREREFASPRAALFLREWETLKPILMNTRFLRSDRIHVVIKLTPNSHTLSDEDKDVYVEKGEDKLKIFLSRDNILEVYGALAEELARILHLDLLPGSLKDDLFKLISGNLGRLDNPRFEELLAHELKKKGFPIEEDLELQKMMATAEETISGAYSPDTGSITGESENGVNERGEPSRPASDEIDMGKPREGRLRTPPLTVEGILEQLPALGDESYGKDKVTDVSSGSVTEHEERPRPTSFCDWRDGRIGIDFETRGAYQKAYGIRGEKWVVGQERWSLKKAGRPNLAARVVHRSLQEEGCPWDIESFAKEPPFEPINIEVKSTSDPNNFTIVMSKGQIRAALSPDMLYYIYRVVEVNTMTPHANKYNFRQLYESKLLRFSSKKVEFFLPKPP